MTNRQKRSMRKNGNKENNYVWHIQIGNKGNMDTVVGTVKLPWSTNDMVGLYSKSPEGALNKIEDYLKDTSGNLRATNRYLVMDGKKGYYEMLLKSDNRKGNITNDLVNWSFITFEEEGTNATFHFDFTETGKGVLNPKVWVWDARYVVYLTNKHMDVTTLEFISRDMVAVKTFPKGTVSETTDIDEDRNFLHIDDAHKELRGKKLIALITPERTNSADVVTEDGDAKIVDNWVKDGKEGAVILVQLVRDEFFDILHLPAEQQMKLTKTALGYI